MILVTGASGYLGRHVMEALAQRRAVAHGINRSDVDLANHGQVQWLLDAVHPKTIIHCAARVPKTPEQYNDWRAAAESFRMIETLCGCGIPIVFASSWTAADPMTSIYACGKRLAEYQLVYGAAMRLPGLFGLPRRSGVIYDAAHAGVIPESFGPYPAMHVKDAAEYLVRAATMPNDGYREPFSVTYGDARVEACYGSLGVTLGQRVQEFADLLRNEGAA